MKTVATILVGVVAAAHLGFMAIEMFPWKRPFVFRLVQLAFDPRPENEIAAAPIVLNAGPIQRIHSRRPDLGDVCRSGRFPPSLVFPELCDRRGYIRCCHIDA